MTGHVRARRVEARRGEARLGYTLRLVIFPRPDRDWLGKTRLDRITEWLGKTGHGTARPGWTRRG